MSKRFPHGLIKVYRIPKNAVKFVTESGQDFYAPAETDFQAIHDLAQSELRLETSDAIGQYGMFDFQRNSGRRKQNENYFYDAYTDASNYAVGVYTHGLGQSLDFMLASGLIYALRHSKNAGTQGQVSMWLKGWNDAEAGPNCAANIGGIFFVERDLDDS